jgi:hypothetical protein
VGWRRLANRSHSVPSSTCSCRARSRRVQPRKTRARSITATSTSHSEVAREFKPDARSCLYPQPLASIDPPWKARCYAFRAFPQACSVAFGGPLLGGSDRHRRAAVSRTASACRYAASAPATMRLAERTPYSSLTRGALRARVRARAQVRVSQFARPAPVARLRCTQTSLPTSLRSRS